MSYKVIITSRFEKEIKRLAKKYPSLKSEFADLVSELSTNPLTGTMIGKNCYKVRLAIASKGKGKSGGARVITHFFATAQTVYLLCIYDKSEKAGLMPNELRLMIENLELD